MRVYVIPNYFYTTSATVVDIREKNPFTRRGGRQVNYLPTYTYTDDQGMSRTLESNDGFNSINGILFKREIGESVIAYYEKGSQNGLFITKTANWYIFLLAPLIFAILPIGPIFAVVIYFVYKNRRDRRQLLNETF